MRYEISKSLYVFLASLLGVLMFLLLDRLVVFFYLFLLAGGFVTSSLSYAEFLFIDYFTLTLVLMLGAWYGIWLGLYWYEKIYEQGTHRGLIHHLSTHYFPGPGFKKEESKMAVLRSRLTEDLNQLENLTQRPFPKRPPAIKRKIVRRRAPKKLNPL